MNAERAASRGACTLGLDLGTSSAKAVVLEVGGTVLAQASAGYPVTSAAAGHAESDPEQWWEAVTACARKAVAVAAWEPPGRWRSGCRGRCTGWS